jgi:hypothetical protein
MNRTEFIKIIFSNLDANIEIRELGNDINQSKRRKFFNSVEQAQAYVPPEDKNVYFGVYTRLGKNGTAVGCMTTKVIWADYDNKSLAEVKRKIKEKGVPEASLYVNSGHGVHAYWILKERIGDDATLIAKAIVMRTGADPKSAEKARIMRLPGTYNLKDIPVLCRIEEYNDFVYKIEDLKVVFCDEINNMQEAAVRTGSKEEIKELSQCSRSCLKIMANGVIQGHRNFALCKITKYLQLRGYTRKAALDVIRRWNTLNIPPKQDKELLTEFNKVWETDYKMLGCRFKENEVLQKQSDYFCSMGECKYAAVQRIDEITSDGASKIDNLIFQDDIYPNVSGLELAIYFTIAKTEGITREHLSNIIGSHTKNRNFMKSLEHLIELQLIKIIKGNKRLNEKDLLILGSQFTHGRGYTIINNLLSETFLGRRITDTEYKLSALLKSFSYSNDSAYPSRIKLATIMGTTEKTISNLLSSLDFKKYIKRTYKKTQNGGTRLYIKLLF